MYAYSVLTEAYTKTERLQYAPFEQVSIFFHKLKRLRFSVNVKQ